MNKIAFDLRPTLTTPKFLPTLSRFGDLMDRKPRSKLETIGRKLLRIVRGKSAAGGGYRPWRTSKDQWKSRYASGCLDRYRQLDQLAHYMVIVGYCHYFNGAAAILDVGCGQGILQERLGGSYRIYVGIDSAAEAIRQAASKQDDKTVFIEADANRYAPEQPFDIIVFNECLYYLEDPLAAVRRYERYLAEDGIFIVSMYARPKSMNVWRMLEGAYRAIDEVRITHKKGTTWIIKVFTPAEAKSSSVH